MLEGLQASDGDGLSAASIDGGGDGEALSDSGESLLSYVCGAALNAAADSKPREKGQENPASDREQRRIVEACAPFLTKHTKLTFVGHCDLNGSLPQLVKEVAD